MLDSIKDYVKKLNWKDVITLAVTFFIIFFVIKMLFGGVFGISLVVIENDDPNSMYPTYFKGDMFVLYEAKPENIKLGDVIVYDSLNPASFHILIIHRVINITIIEEADGLQYYYRVSGDNPSSNSYSDYYDGVTTLIPYEAILGKTVFHIPKLGYVRLWLSSSPIIQYTFIGVLILVTLYLIFAPEGDKKNETKKNG